MHQKKQAKRKMVLRKETGCKVLSETRQGENKPEDVSAGTSIWNYKACYGSHLFSSKGMRKVAGEFVLFCLGYNLERDKNLLGFLIK